MPLLVARRIETVSGVVPWATGAPITQLSNLTGAAFHAFSMREDQGGGCRIRNLVELSTTSAHGRLPPQSPRCSVATVAVVKIGSSSNACNLRPRRCWSWSAGAAPATGSRSQCLRRGNRGAVGPSSVTAPTGSPSLNSGRWTPAAAFFRCQSAPVVSRSAADPGVGRVACGTPLAASRRYLPPGAASPPASRPSRCGDAARACRRRGARGSARERCPLPGSVFRG